MNVRVGYASDMHGLTNGGGRVVRARTIGRGGQKPTAIFGGFSLSASAATAGRASNHPRR